ncbi:SDR family oxidoreductase [Amycolatopsis japonica]
MVTGGGSGPGRAFAEALGAAGLSVVVAGRAQDNLAEIVRGIRVFGGTATRLTLDIMDKASVARGIGQVLDELGGLDVLVNTADAAGPVGPLWAAEEQEWRHATEAGLFGAALVSHIALPELTGRVVNVVSRGSKADRSLEGVFAAAKSAVTSLTASLARELSQSGRTAIAFDPGWGDWTSEARDQAAEDALVAVVLGAADHLNGRCVSVSDVVDLWGGEVDTSARGRALTHVQAEHGQQIG